MHGRLLFGAIAASILLTADGVRAGGFSVFEAGSRALGSGGAFVARADDASAVFYNPAGLTDLSMGWQATAGVSVIFTGTSFAGVDPNPGYGVQEKTEDHVFTPINAYISYKFNEKFAAGVGLMNPFGLAQTWVDPSVFTGRHISTHVELVTFNINPVVAYRPHEVVSIAAGAQMVYSHVELDRYLEQWDPNGSGFLDIGTTKLSGSSGDLDFGWNAGLMFDFMANARVGVNYRSTVTLKIEGDADFTQTPSGNPSFDAAVAAIFPVDQGVTTEVHLPDMLWLGGLYNGVADWKFLLDLVFFGWSEFKELGFEFASDPSLNQLREQNYDDTVQIRLGAEYQLNDVMALRMGYYYDPTPQPEPTMSPLLADTDRNGVTLGFGYAKDTWWVDAFGLVLFAKERSTGGVSSDDYNGSYGSYGYLFGANVGLKF